MTEALGSANTLHNELNTEVRTFLFADVRGYTRFTQQQGDEAGAKLAARFAEIARDVVKAGSGEVIELRGDEALAVFASARQALRTATELQRRFGEETRQTQLPLKVGIGVDAGEAIPLEGGYRGGALNLGARLCSLAGPGEILASEGVVHLARKVDGVAYAERGRVQLKGFDDPVRVVQVTTQGETASPAPESKEPPAEHALPIGGFLGALPAGLLIARSDELSRVLTSVDAVAGGSGRLVLLAGEPGVGKTRLAQEVTLAVRNRDFLVASGRCYEPYESVPFYPFLEALTTAYLSSPQTVRSEAQTRWPYLGRLLPDHIAPPALAEGQEEQQRLFRAVTGFLVAVSEVTPIALLLDDLHWADSSSLELLQHLARHTRAHRILLLATYRDVEVQRQHPLGKALRDLNREQLLDRISVRRLNAAETSLLVAQTFGQSEISPEFADLIQSQTEGNPFFTQEVLRALVERGDIYRENGDWERKEIAEIEVPESVREAIGERLGRLSDSAQEMLREASVLGQTFKFEDLQAIGDHAEDDLEAALEEATDAGLLREVVGDEYAFSHALVQQTLDAELSLRRKRRLHLAAGDALERLPSEVRERRTPELAWHFLQADDPERALVYSLLAGELAHSLAAHDEAEKHFRTTVDLARELGNQVSHAQASEKLGQTLQLLARYDEALSDLDNAIELFRLNNDIESMLRVGALIGAVHHARSTHREGLERLESLAAGVDEHQYAHVLPPLYVELALLLVFSDREEEAFEMTERSVELARFAGNAQALAKSLVNYGAALFFRGRPQEARSASQEAMELAEQVQDHAVLYEAATNVAELLEAAGELDQALKYRKRSLESAQRLGDLTGIFFAHANIAQTLIFQGHWEAARVQLQRSNDILGDLATSWFSAYPSLTLGCLSLLEGNSAEASRLLDEASKTSKASDSQLQSIAERQLAQIDLLEGRGSEALDRLAPVAAGAGPPLMITYSLPTLAEAYLALDDLERADETASLAISRALEQSRLLTLVEVLRVQGMVRSRQGRWDDAEKAFADSVSKTREIGYPYAEGRALYDWAVIQLNKDDAEAGPARHQQARKHLQQALHIFRELGAKRDAQQAEEALLNLDKN